ncbi:hypothetical protein [Streptomyces katsurahamanus]|uniref:Uncharacterized protein n=1 Tax=Streptomyces katsurahamanus TaxID=2577098 RepID=A0ABW9NSB8_9ACTN|nr:hypothetical protein [Streptomyces katsurahamanus]MQS36203.1 hypothetical protein [Streptomyces katsurahamanus]
MVLPGPVGGVVGALLSRAGPTGVTVCSVRNSPVAQPDTMGFQDGGTGAADQRAERFGRAP